MTYYAKIINGKVDSVIVCDSQNIQNYDGEWIKLKNKNEASIGYDFDNIIKQFKGPKPFPSWIFKNEKWESPIPLDTGLDPQLYVWDEDLQNWKVRPNSGN